MREREIECVWERDRDREREREREGGGTERKKEVSKYSLYKNYTAIDILWYYFYSSNPSASVY